MSWDASRNSVSLLLHGETLTDSSPTPNTLTAGGNAAVSAAQKKRSSRALGLAPGLARRAREQGGPNSREG